MSTRPIARVTRDSTPGAEAKSNLPPLISSVAATGGLPPLLGAANAATSASGPDANITPRKQRLNGPHTSRKPNGIDNDHAPTPPSRPRRRGGGPTAAGGGSRRARVVVERTGDHGSQSSLPAPTSLSRLSHRSILDSTEPHTPLTPRDDASGSEIEEEEGLRRFIAHHPPGPTVKHHVWSFHPSMKDDPASIVPTGETQEIPERIDASVGGADTDVDAEARAMLAASEMIYEEEWKDIEAEETLKQQRRREFDAKTAAIGNGHSHQPPPPPLPNPPPAVVPPISLPTDGAPSQTASVAASSNSPGKPLKRQGSTGSSTSESGGGGGTSPRKSSRSFASPRHKGRNDSMWSNNSDTGPPEATLGGWTSSGPPTQGSKPTLNAMPSRLKQPEPIPTATATTTTATAASSTSAASIALANAAQSDLKAAQSHIAQLTNQLTAKNLRLKRVEKENDALRAELNQTKQELDRERGKNAIRSSSQTSMLSGGAGQAPGTATLGGRSLPQQQLKSQLQSKRLQVLQEDLSQSQLKCNKLGLALDSMRRRLRLKVAKELPPGVARMIQQQRAMIQELKQQLVAGGGDGGVAATEETTTAEDQEEQYEEDFTASGTQRKSSSLPGSSRGGRKGSATTNKDGAIPTGAGVARKNSTATARATSKPSLPARIPSQQINKAQLLEAQHTISEQSGLIDSLQSEVLRLNKVQHKLLADLGHGALLQGESKFYDGDANVGPPVASSGDTLEITSVVDPLGSDTDGESSFDPLDSPKRPTKPIQQPPPPVLEEKQLESATVKRILGQGPQSPTDAATTKSSSPRVANDVVLTSPTSAATAAGTLIVPPSNSTDPSFISLTTSLATIQTTLQAERHSSSQALSVLSEELRSNRILLEQYQSRHTLSDRLIKGQYAQLVALTKEYHSRGEIMHSLTNKLRTLTDELDWTKRELVAISNPSGPDGFNPIDELQEKQWELEQEREWQEMQQRERDVQQRMEQQQRVQHSASTASKYELHPIEEQQRPVKQSASSPAVHLLHQPSPPSTTAVQQLPTISAVLQNRTASVVSIQSGPNLSPVPTPIRLTHAPPQRASAILLHSLAQQQWTPSYPTGFTPPGQSSSSIVVAPQPTTITARPSPPLPSTSTPGESPLALAALSGRGSGNWKDYQKSLQQQ